MNAIISDKGKVIISTILVLLIIQPLTIFAQDTNYRFTGQEFDSSINLYDFKTRSYNPNIGTFIQADSYLQELMLKGVDPSEPEFQRLLQNPQLLNERSYVSNNPVKYVDPKGNIPILPIIFGVLSGIFLSNVSIAHAPNYNSTSQIVQTKNFGDLVSGWNEIPEFGRFGAGLMFGGLSNKASSKVSNMVDGLATRMDIELAKNLSKNVENGFISFYRGLHNQDQLKNVMENGFRGAKWFTAKSSDALSYAKRFFLDNDAVVKIKMPFGEFSKLINKNLFREGTDGNEFSIIHEGIEIINKYIIK